MDLNRVQRSLGGRGPNGNVLDGRVDDKRALRHEQSQDGFLPERGQTENLKSNSDQENKKENKKIVTVNSKDVKTKSKK